MVLQVACDGDADVVLEALVARDGDADVAPDSLVARAALLARDGDAPLAGVPPLVAPHCYTSTRYTRNISNRTSCS